MTICNNFLLIYVSAVSTVLDQVAMDSKSLSGSCGNQAVPDSKSRSSVDQLAAHGSGVNEAGLHSKSVDQSGPQSKSHHGCVEGLERPNFEGLYI